MQTTINLTFNLPTSNLTTTATRPVEAFGCTINAQTSNQAQIAIIRLHKVVGEREYIAWLHKPRNGIGLDSFVELSEEEVNAIPFGSWPYHTPTGEPKPIDGTTPMGVWLPLRYKASFTRRGETPLEFFGNTYDTAIAQIDELHRTKRKEDESRVVSLDGAPPWWTR